MADARTGPRARSEKIESIGEGGNNRLLPSPRTPPFAKVRPAPPGGGENRGSRSRFQSPRTHHARERTNERTNKLRSHEVITRRNPDS
jgi:hypothetical protein